VPSFDHRVTQWRSTVTVSLGSSRNDFQSHRRKTLAPSLIANSHLSSGTCGVGPADKTGKSVVRYCPGGSFTSAALRRPEKPREIVGIASLERPPSRPQHFSHQSAHSTWPQLQVSPAITNLVSRLSRERPGWHHLNTESTNGRMF
jgi:hypothetical protein